MADTCVDANAELPWDTAIEPVVPNLAEEAVGVCEIHHEVGVRYLIHREVAEMLADQLEVWKHLD